MKFIKVHCTKIKSPYYILTILMPMFALLLKLYLGLPLIYQFLFDKGLLAEEKAVVKKLRERLLNM